VKRRDLTDPMKKPICAEPLIRPFFKKENKDLLIGATAIALNTHLYTRNRKHYSRLQKYGLKLYEKRRS